MATLKDIATLCGISTTTVSLVLNGRHTRVGISAETRARVLAAAKELHYVFNTGARNIRSGRSDAIGIVSNFAPDSVYIWSVLSSITKASARLNYTTKFFLYSADDEDGLIRQIVGHRVAGVLITFSPTGFAAKLARECAYSDIPVVAINSLDTNEISCPNFTADDAMGGRLAAEALVKAGCRRIIYILQTQSPHLYWYRQRIDSFLATLAARAPEVETVPVTQEDVVNLSPSSDLGRLLLSDRAPDGIFCHSDDYAFPVERFAIRNGISIPDKLSIVGYGNHLGGALLPIPLTTIVEPLAQMGEQALELLLSKKNLEPARHLLPVQLLRRETLK